MIDIINPMIKQFLPFAQERMGFNHPPKLFLRGSPQNAANPLGKTAFYDPKAKSVTIYITDRHPKDVMRSLSHELVHHTQNCRGDFDTVGEMGEGYAQNDEHLREMEREAYEKGNMCFRDWEDSIKSTIYFEHLQKGATKTMSTKEWKNGELTTLLSEAWGFNFDSTLLTETGAKDTGASKGDKGKDPDDPEARDYEHGGDRKGDESKTHKGKDYMNEDSGEEEKHDYEHDDWQDKDHLDALIHHAHELRKDMDYDHDHESLDEADIEETVSGRKTRNKDRRGDDPRKRPMEEVFGFGKKDAGGEDADGDGCVDAAAGPCKRCKSKGGRWVGSQGGAGKCVYGDITEDQIRTAARRVITRMKEGKKNG